MTTKLDEWAEECADTTGWEKGRAEWNDTKRGFLAGLEKFRAEALKKKQESGNFWRMDDDGKLHAVDVVLVEDIKNLGKGASDEKEK